MRFPNGERPQINPPEKWTPIQVISWYKKHDTSLHRSALQHHFLNLVGTSFLHTTVAGIQSQLALQQQHPELRIVENPVNALTLYTSMNGMNTEPLGLDTIESATVRNEAKLALASALGQPYYPRSIMYNPMRPGEMVFELSRHDDIYESGTSLQKAYSHLTRQAFYFRNGLLVDSIALSSVYYPRPDGNTQQHNLLMEGLHDLPFFIDAAQKPLKMVEPDAQNFDVEKSMTTLYISPHFSYSKARYKRPDRREMQPGYMPGIFGLMRRFIKGNNSFL